MKQRNFEDLMYDLQSLKEKNERLKDRVRELFPNLGPGNMSQAGPVSLDDSVLPRSQHIC